MDDLLLKLWPYLERSGVVAGVLCLAGLAIAIKVIKQQRIDHDIRVAKLEADLAAERKKNDFIQEERIKDVTEIVAVVERNTAILAHIAPRSS